MSHSHAFSVHQASIAAYRFTCGGIWCHARGTGCRPCSMAVKYFTLELGCPLLGFSLPIRQGHCGSASPKIFASPRRTFVGPASFAATSSKSTMSRLDDTSAGSPSERLSAHELPSQNIFKIVSSASKRFRSSERPPVKQGASSHTRSCVATCTNSGGDARLPSTSMPTTRGFCCQKISHKCGPLQSPLGIVSIQPLTAASNLPPITSSIDATGFDMCSCTSPLRPSTALSATAFSPSFLSSHDTFDSNKYVAPGPTPVPTSTHQMPSTFRKYRALHPSWPQMSCSSCVLGWRGGRGFDGIIDAAHARGTPRRVWSCAGETVVRNSPEPPKTEASESSQWFRYHFFTSSSTDETHRECVLCGCALL